MQLKLDELTEIHVSLLRWLLGETFPTAGVLVLS